MATRTPKRLDFSYNPVFEMSSSDKNPGWSTLQALSAAVVSKEIDGFFVQYEYQARIPNKWPEGKAVRIYRSHKGLLYFRPGAWTNYGFKNEAAFQRALKTGGSVSQDGGRGAFSWAGEAASWKTTLWFHSWVGPRNSTDRFTGQSGISRRFA